MTQKLFDVAKTTNRKELHWISGRKQELDVYRVPLQHLYFNIENGRYADRMYRLRTENPGVEIDPRKEKWAVEIERMLAGEHHDTSQDKAAFEKLIQDINQREQLSPGVVKYDGGVIDGNRRFAALRRLNRSNHKTDRFGFFEAVILPKDTTHEDLWRIEAGRQLGIEERWNYTPINELLKIREGLNLYENLISQGKHQGKTAIQLVSASIYGRSESAIEENASRLRLMDDYLAFIKKKGEYDVIGRVSERFVEANKILRAAKNKQLDATRYAKLQAILFYLIHTEKMDSYELRNIYDAMGGDPKRKGRKPTQNPQELEKFFAQFPDVRELQSCLNGELSTKPAPAKPSPKPAAKSSLRKEAASKSEATPSKKTLEVDSKADVAVETFLVNMNASN